MPRASAADAARTAEQILTVATRLFAEHGHAAVSLDDVARAAGVTRGAVYHHYRSKGGLFSAVAARLQADVARAVVAGADAAGQDPIDQLRAGSHGFLDAITSGPMLRILLVDAPTVVGWQEWRRVDEENSGSHLRDALLACGTSPEEVDVTAALLSGAMNEAALWVADQADPATALVRAHTLLDRLLDAVVPR